MIPQDLFEDDRKAPQLTRRGAHVRPTLLSKYLGLEISAANTGRHGDAAPPLVLPNTTSYSMLSSVLARPGARALRRPATSIRQATAENEYSPSSTERLEDPPCELGKALNGICYWGALDCCCGVAHAPRITRPRIAKCLMSRTLPLGETGGQWRRAVSCAARPTLADTLEHMTATAPRPNVFAKRHPISHVLVAALALLVSDTRADAKPPSSAHQVNTGDLIPRTPVVDRRCKDRHAGATRWLDSNPHVPFFISARERIESAPAACCAPWAVRGSRWRTIDRYGEVVGTAQVVGGEGYDVTQCYELELDVVKGNAGIGIFASQSGDWRPAVRSARWEPSKEETEGLMRMVGGLVSLLDKPTWRPEGERWPPPFEDRILPFQIQPDADRDQRGGRFAAVGGRVLIIARLDGATWKLSYLDASIAMAGGNGVRPLAAFDIDGDAIPELIYNWDAGDSWADVVLRLDSQGWSEAAESVGGSTA